MSLPKFRSRRPEIDAPSCGATYFKSKHPLLWIDYILLCDYTLSVTEVALSAVLLGG